MRIRNGERPVQGTGRRTWRATPARRAARREPRLRGCRGDARYAARVRRSRVRRRNGQHRPWESAGHLAIGIPIRVCATMLRTAGQLPRPPAPVPDPKTPCNRSDAARGCGVFPTTGKFRLGAAVTEVISGQAEGVLTMGCICMMRRFIRASFLVQSRRSRRCPSTRAHARPVRSHVGRDPDLRESRARSTAHRPS